VFSVTAGAADVALASETLRVEGGIVEARLDGPVSSPSGTMRVTASAVSASSVMPVPVEAQLSLKSGRADVAAKVPDWAASVTGHASVQAPHEFTATLSIADRPPTASTLVGAGSDKVGGV
jgi:hypothetical protein